MTREEFIEYSNSRLLKVLRRKLGGDFISDLFEVASECGYCHDFLTITRSFVGSVQPTGLSAIPALYVSQRTILEDIHIGFLYIPLKDLKHRYLRISFNEGLICKTQHRTNSMRTGI